MKKKKKKNTFTFDIAIHLVSNPLDMCAQLKVWLIDIDT